VETPPEPLDETKRLRTLQSLRILDTLPEERFDRVTRLACRLFNVPIALVSLVDEHRQWFKSRQGLSASETDRDVSFCGHAILHEGTLVVTDSHRDQRFADNPLVAGDPGIRFYAGHPIHASDGARIGTLCVIDRKPRVLSEAETALLADLASMIDSEFSMLEQSTTDELTGLSNRRGLALIAKYILPLCRRAGLAATVIGIDLDNFKRVNDEHGHQAGDEVLRAFAKMLQKHLRQSDVVARIGGDEFALLCSKASPEQLALALKRLRDSFASSDLARRYPFLSWSAGLAEFDPQSAADIDSLLRDADTRMYGAKQLAKQTPHGPTNGTR
jgi:diguanylate cyclase (GGDEF)-like protein